MIDLRQPVKLLNTYKSFTGSVSCIRCDPLSPLMMSTSIDRHLRIHDMETKELLHKVREKSKKKQLN